MMRHIKHCTEAEARHRTQDDSWTVDTEELDAFVAVMYARGVYGAKYFPLKSLWSTVWRPLFFRQTMGQNKVIEIMKYMRFDTKSTRSERLKADKFALVSDTWNAFIENRVSCYKTEPYLTVDEQLLLSKTRCPFTQYIASKSDKFGIKFWLLVGVSSKYILNGFPYTSADPLRLADQGVGENVVLRLMGPYLGKSLNVTTDSHFTSLSLAHRLRAASTTLVGTLNRNRREVPPAAKTRKQTLHSTIVYKNDEGTTSTVYQGKTNKNVLLLSSLHSHVSLSDSQKKTPVTVQFYNETKFGFDVVDQMTRMCSAKAGTRHWPMHVFYNILDLAAINSWVLYKEVTGMRLSRRKHIFDLCEELQAQYVSPRNKEPDQNHVDTKGRPQRATKREKCKIRTSCKGNHTATVCSGCEKAVCGKSEKRRRV
ncbi:piggyBac transposable element-derived protein 4-like [Schistocerca piceifrons]|uniref:piggyBac transposable element-derived protein 4-like n=1 Tax=Schistocerca piceifrons TaxID=274613 RepID=UPI001F5F0F84|nr:piggyBac transposable element-derived protein 4-like [Schistocerca piceifrons]